MVASNDRKVDSLSSQALKSPVSGTSDFSCDGTGMGDISGDNDLRNLSKSAIFLDVLDDFDLLLKAAVPSLY